MADALPCEIERVKLDSSLIDDLGAQSIDFLDIVFRLERAFKVKIPRGKIIEEARVIFRSPNSTRTVWFLKPAWPA